LIMTGLPWMVGRLRYLKGLCRLTSEFCLEIFPKKVENKGNSNNIILAWESSLLDKAFYLGVVKDEG
jgi:hypothetical protein